MFQKNSSTFRRKGLKFIGSTRHFQGKERGSKLCFRLIFYTFTFNRELRPFLERFACIEVHRGCWGFHMGLFSPTAESFGVSAKLGPGALWGSHPSRFQERVPSQGSGRFKVLQVKDPGGSNVPSKK